MRFSKRWVVLSIFFLGGLIVACSTAQPESRYFNSHPTPDDLGVARPSVCTDCHEDPDQTLVWDQFNHTASFARQHDFAASRNGAVCSMCHQRNFCSDCHATRVELKPSLKNQSDTYRQMPHRGDYLARHRIDGKVDPTSCFRCHGNPKTAETCSRCHG